MCGNTLKHITVTKENFYALKRLGNAGDSFNDVITGLLQKLGSLQIDLRIETPHQSAVNVKNPITTESTTRDTKAR